MRHFPRGAQQDLPVRPRESQKLQEHRSLLTPGSSQSTPNLSSLMIYYSAPQSFYSETHGLGSGLIEGSWQLWVWHLSLHTWWSILMIKRLVPESWLSKGGTVRACYKLPKELRTSRDLIGCFTCKIHLFGLSSSKINMQLCAVFSFSFLPKQNTSLQMLSPLRDKSTNDTWQMLVMVTLYTTGRHLGAMEMFMA